MLSNDKLFTSSANKQNKKVISSLPNFGFLLSNKLSADFWDNLTESGAGVISKSPEQQKGN